MAFSGLRRPDDHFYLPPPGSADVKGAAGGIPVGRNLKERKKGLLHNESDYEVRLEWLIIQLNLLLFYREPY